MEKLTHVIPQFRIGELTKKTIQKMADNDKRKLTHFIRIKLEEMAENYNNKYTKKYK